MEVITNETGEISKLIFEVSKLTDKEKRDEFIDSVILPQWQKDLLDKRRKSTESYPKKKSINGMK